MSANPDYKMYYYTGKHPAADVHVCAFQGACTTNTHWQSLQL